MSNKKEQTDIDAGKELKRFRKMLEKAATLEDRYNRGENLTKDELKIMVERERKKKQDAVLMAVIITIIVVSLLGYFLRSYPASSSYDNEPQRPGMGVEY